MSNIKKMIQENLEFITRAETLSAAILEKVEQGNFNGVENSLENRERLISIVMTTFEKIEKAIEADDFTQKFMPTEVDLLKEWSLKLSDFIGKIQSFDERLIKHLEEYKTEISSEITQIFKIKQKFKGYNLNNLRK